MSGLEDQELAEFVAQRDAELKAEALSVRNEAAAAGTLAWDPFDRAWKHDPYAVYRELRQHNPVHRSPLGFWVFTRHADCLAVLRDKRSSSDGRRADEALSRLRSIDVTSPNGAFAEQFEDLAPFLFRDPPDHTRLRGLVQKAFTPRVVEQLRPRAEQICASLIDDMLDKGSVDLVADYAYPLPVQIIVEMLGVPAEDHAQFRTWSEALARGLDPDFLLPPEAVQQRLVGILSFAQYFISLIEERRARPRQDLLSDLIRVEEQGEGLSQGELVSTCILLLVAGHETTVNLIAGGALALAQNTEQRQRFVDDASVHRTAVEELMRYVCPVQLTGRVATETMEVGGVEMEAGEFCMLLLGSANRDPAVFSDPEELDITRSDNPQLGFGFGLHHCLGAPLARVEAQVALSSLFSRTHVEPHIEGLVHKENIVLRGLEHLPVELAAV